MYVLIFSLSLACIFFGSLLNFLVNNLSLYNLKVEPTVVYVEGNMSLHPKVCILEAFVQYL